jgi:hypothetical protein
MDPAAEHPSQSTSSASSVVKGAMGTISSGLLDARPESSSIPSLKGKAKLQDAPGPPTSFLFIVNEQPTNDDPDIPGSVGLGIAMDATSPQTLFQDFWPKIQGMFIGGQTV